VMALVLALVFRSRLRLLPLAVALAAVAITFGLMSLLGASLTMASIAVLPVLSTLVVDQALIGLLRGGTQFVRNLVFAAGKLGLLSLAVVLIAGASGVMIFATWVAGFDLFYSLFDVEVDRAQGLHSWAVRWGENSVFAAARTLHVATIGFLFVAGLGLSIGVWYWLGVIAVAAMLAYEHALVGPGDLDRLDAAFFTMNGVLSLTFFGFVLAGRVFAQ